MAVILADNALTTLATVEEALGLTVGGGTADDYLNRMINVYSQLVENWTGRKFNYTAVTDEQKNGYGTRRLLVDYYPIDTGEITSVTFDDGAVDSTVYEWEKGGVSGSLFNLDGTWNNTALLQPNIAGDRAPGTEKPLYKISYTGGYILPPAGATRTLPYDIENVVVDLVSTAYRQKGRDRTIKSEKLLSSSVTYMDYESLPLGYKTILTAYTRLF